VQAGFSVFRYALNFCAFIAGDPLDHVNADAELIGDHNDGVTDPRRLLQQS
jgi:hypothetical protein